MAARELRSAKRREGEACGAAFPPARGRAGGGRGGGGGVGDIGRCWAGAKAGREELLQGRAGRTELPANEGLEEDGRP